MSQSTAEQQEANCRRWAELLRLHTGAAGRQYLHTRDANGVPQYCAWGLAIEALAQSRGHYPDQVWTPDTILADGATIYRASDTGETTLPGTAMFPAFGFPERLIAAHCTEDGCHPDVRIPLDDLAAEIANAIPFAYLTDDCAAVTIGGLSDAVGAAGWPGIALFLERHAASLTA